MKSAEMNPNQPLTLHELMMVASIWRLKSETIVFTNGCFDILHRGHVQYLSQAAALGDRLVVGLNSDQSVAGLKGPSRPLNPASDRAAILAALHCVAAVVVFEQDTPVEIIRKLKPDILVKGGDYAINQIAGADIVQANAGKVVTLPFLEGYGTTGLIERLKKI
jgi:rfaE bifunctional protein nucleotidyltransferase chain/domain